MTTCQCGCGAQVKRSFLPGHDAKLKSRLVAEAKTTNKWWIREAAVNALLERHWGHFLSTEVLCKVPVRNRYNGRFVKSYHMWEIEMFWTDSDECAHAHNHCPAAKGDATPSPERGGWLCTACIHTSDVQEQVGFVHFKQVVMAA